jgi:hypothetical protein
VFTLSFSRLSSVALICSLLTGCASGFDAAASTISQAWSARKSLPSPRELNPDFQYLWVQANGVQAYLALGGIEPHPQGPIEVWFSARSEILRLQNGRIVGTTGMPVNWSNVTLRFDSQGKSYTRQRDETPGYRFNLQDSFVVQESRAVPASVMERFQSMQAKGAKAPAPVIWREDITQGVPSIRVGLAVNAQGQPPVAVYGEECLSKAFCITWQRL